MEGTGWHKSQAMKLAENMRILFLPPYSPELNPQEHVLDELRKSSFITVPWIIWICLRYIWGALKSLESKQETMCSIAGWDWIIMLFLSRIGITC